MAQMGGRGTMSSHFDPCSKGSIGNGHHIITQGKLVSRYGNSVRFVVHTFGLDSNAHMFLRIGVTCMLEVAGIPGVYGWLTLGVTRAVWGGCFVVGRLIL